MRKRGFEAFEAELGWFELKGLKRAECALFGFSIRNSASKL